MSENNSKKAIKSGIWYTAGNLFSSAVSFLATPFFIRIMSKSELGDYSAFTSWAVIAESVVTVNLFNSIAVAKYDFKEKRDEYNSSILVLGSLITLSFYLVVILLMRYVLRFTGMGAKEIHLLFVYLLVAPALNIFQAGNRVDYRYRTVVIVSMSAVVLSTLFSFILVFRSEDRYWARIVGNYLPLVALNLIIYIYLMIKGKKINTEYWRYALGISVPMVWHVLASTVLVMSDRIMIKQMCGSDDAALYSVASTCALIISILSMSMGNAWAPWAYEQMNDKRTDYLRKASKPYIVFFCIVVLGFLLFAPEVLLIMGGKNYAEVINCIPPVMISYVVQFIYSLYVNIETYYKKQKYIAVASSVAAVVNIILNYLLIPVYGYGVAAYTTLAGYSVLLLVHLLFVNRMKKIYYYDLKYNFCVLAIFIALIPVVNTIYRFTVLRYSIIGLLIILVVVIFYVFRSELRYLIKNRSFDKIIERINAIRSGGLRK